MLSYAELSDVWNADLNCQIGVECFHNIWETVYGLSGLEIYYFLFKITEYRDLPLPKKLTHNKDAPVYWTMYVTKIYKQKRMKQNSN